MFLYFHAPNVTEMTILRAQRKEKSMENKMNQQQKLKAAKDLTKERFKDFIGDCVQIDDYKWVEPIQ